MTTSELIEVEGVAEGVVGAVLGLLPVRLLLPLERLIVSSEISEYKWAMI